MKRGFFIYRLRCIFLACLMVFSAMLSPAGRASALSSPEEEITVEEEVAAETAAAKDMPLSAMECAVEGKTAYIKSIALFSPDSHIQAATTQTNGYRYIWKGDGAATKSCAVPSGSTGELFALVRLGNKHYAGICFHTEEEDPLYLWVLCYNISSPVIMPAVTEERTYGTGDSASFRTGIPDMEITLVDKAGNDVTTAVSDEAGLVIFDRIHAADGEDHPVSVLYTFGNYNYHAATAYASSPGNLLPSVGGTDYEWVMDNDCATYLSRVLSAGGFPVYTPYANKDSIRGGSLCHVLKALVGEQYYKTVFTIDDFHEGDIVWTHNGIHSMYCAGVNREAETVHLYAHSTSSNSAFTDDCWAPISEITSVMQMVREESVPYSWRIPILSGEADLVLPAGTLQIEESAFEGIPAESVYIPDGCLFIGVSAFAGCAGLRQVRIPAGCAVDDTAFDRCSGLTIFGEAGSPAENFCAAHPEFRFVICSAPDSSTG